MAPNFLRKQTYKQTTKLPAGANATYEISVVSYTYAAKGVIMWRLITNKEETKYKLYRMQYEKIKATERRQR